MGKAWVGALLGVALSGTPAFAAADGTGHGALSLLVENDLFFNTDRHYTNGIEFTYTRAPQDTWQWAVDLARNIPFFAKDAKDIRTSFSIGQDMFTPSDTRRANPDPLDRPYAGYLFVSAGVIAISDDRLDQLRLQVGMIGPASLAEDAQKFVHSIIDVRKPSGWSFQLRDEPGVEMTYETAMKFPWLQKMAGGLLDAEPHFGAAIGNVYDYVNAGFMLRAGFNMPNDFGPMRLDPSQPGSSYFDPDNDELSAYVFAGIDARAVGHNIFLDGNTFHASRSVDKNILVGDLLFGAAVSFCSWRVAFTHVIRTREFKTQDSTDQFGAVSLTYRL